MLYNVEELNEQDVHKPVTIPGMIDMQSQDVHKPVWVPNAKRI